MQSLQKFWNELIRAVFHFTIQLSPREQLEFTAAHTYKNYGSLFEQYKDWIFANQLQENSELYRLFYRGGIVERDDMAMIILKTTRFCMML